MWRTGGFPTSEREEKLEFNLSQVMASPSLEDACYSIDVLKRLILKEMGTLSPPLDPLEACLIGSWGHRIDSHSNEEKDYIQISSIRANHTSVDTHWRRFLMWKFNSLIKTKRVLPRWNWSPYPPNLGMNFLAQIILFLLLLVLQRPPDGKIIGCTFKA